jgi:hypothetical protein
MRNIPNRRVNKAIDRDREDRRFVLYSQMWIKRHLICLVRCLRCGGDAAVKGGHGRFACEKCGRRSSMGIVRAQVRKGDKIASCRPMY